MRMRLVSRTCFPRRADNSEVLVLKDDLIHVWVGFVGWLTTLELGKKDHPARLEISNNATAERAPYLTRLPLVPDYIPPQHRTIFRFAVRQREEFH